MGMSDKIKKFFKTTNASAHSLATFTNSNGSAGDEELLNLEKKMIELAGLTKSAEANKWLVYQQNAGKPFPWELQEAQEQLVVFFGFNGMLANRYCYVIMTREQIQTQINTQTFGVKIPYTIYAGGEWTVVLDKLGSSVTSNFQEVKFEEAMKILRDGVPLLSEADYDDSNVEVEFDEDCLPTCQAGDHKCGK